MPAIERLMKRMGYVRLSRYGLVLTPEGRIMSLRPVLDDGTGGQVVGWRDQDLASAELQKWEPARPAPRGAVAAPLATPIRVSAPVPVPPMAPIAPPIPAIPQAYVAAAEEPEEDEWEWTIALARARAVAEELAAAVMPPPVKFETKTEEYKFETETKPYIEQPKFIAAKTLPMGSRVNDEITAEWPKTEPLTEIERESSRVIARPPELIPARKPKATPAPLPSAPQFPRAKSPSTVIPIPKLPRVTNTNITQSLEPVVRRFPKATPAPGTTLGIAPPPPIRPAEQDKTSPGFLPPAATVVGLPRIPSILKRR